MNNIKFDFLNATKETVDETKNFIKEKLLSVIDTILAVTEKRTFNNTVRPFINVIDVINPLENCIDFVLNFHPEKELRDYSLDVIQHLTDFFVEQTMRRDLYNVYVEYEKEFETEQTKLNSEEIRYFNHMMRDYRRKGLHLDDSNIEVITKKIANLENEFRNNVNNNDDNFMFTKDELDGMPQTWFIGKEPLVKDGVSKYKVTLKYPDYIPLMEYCVNRDIRKQMYIAYNSRCIDVNLDLFSEIVALRYQLVNKLGYATYADYSTEVKIVKNAHTAVQFETELNRLFTKLYESEQEQLLKFAIENDFTEQELTAWDTQFYIRMFKEYANNVNMQEVRQYFPLETVKQGMFSIYEKILQLKFSKIDNNNTWHEHVDTYIVHDNETNEVMGYFYMDLYPRQGKYSHAAIFPLTYGFNSDTNSYYDVDRVLPIACMVCNFPQTEPLSLSDVTTFFHEFGHVMHIICSKTELSSMSSFHVEGDFVEAPSQMLEYWCLHNESLKMMSGKKDTGEKIPDEIIDKIRMSDKLFQGYHNKRQLFLGLMDLWFHTLQQMDKSNINVKQIYDTVYKNIMDKDSLPNICSVATFGHLVGGYQAGYYGYLRSSTYAANMFYKMFEGNELNPEVGMKYRKHILEPGASKDGIVLLENFLGEKPNDKYFMMDKGLSQDDIDTITKEYL